MGDRRRARRGLRADGTGSQSRSARRGWALARAWRRTPSWAQAWARDLSRFARDFAQRLRNGRLPIPGPAGSSHGCRSPSVSASHFISPRNASRPGGRDCRCGRRRCVRDCATRSPDRFSDRACRGGNRSRIHDRDIQKPARRASRTGCSRQLCRSSGFVENREERERSDRFRLRVHRIDAGRSGVTLQRVRLSVRKGTAPAVGSFVTVGRGSIRRCAVSARRLRFCA